MICSGLGGDTLLVTMDLISQLDLLKSVLMLELIHHGHAKNATYLPTLLFGIATFDLP